MMASRLNLCVFLLLAIVGCCDGVKKWTEEELGSDLEHLDVYEKFALLNGVRLMVWSNPPPRGPPGHRWLGYNESDVVIINIGEMIDDDVEELDGSTAYSIPDDRNGPYWFCTGGLPRVGNEPSQKNITCREDMEMNQLYRCASVPSPTMGPEYHFLTIPRKVYSKWYFDCPEEIKPVLFERVDSTLGRNWGEMKFDGTDKKVMVTMEHDEI